VAQLGARLRALIASGVGSGAAEDRRRRQRVEQTGPSGTSRLAEQAGWPDDDDHDEDDARTIELSPYSSRHVFHAPQSLAEPKNEDRPRSSR